MTNKEKPRYTCGCTVRNVEIPYIDEWGQEALLRKGQAAIHWCFDFERKRVDYCTNVFLRSHPHAQWKRVEVTQHWLAPLIESVLNAVALNRVHRCMAGPTFEQVVPDFGCFHYSGD